MSAKHTPGAWVLDWSVSRLDIYSSDASTLVATLRRHSLSSGMDKTAIANAHLIAAAPEMLAALQKLCAIQESGDVASWAPEWAEAQSAIAKATGVRND